MKMKNIYCSLCAVFFVLMISCDSEDSSSNRGDEPDGDSGTDTNDTDESNSDDGCKAMDILFVIDDSGSMQEEQENLVANFPKFIGVLDQYGIDYRVGVTTTGVNRKFSLKLPIFPKMPGDTTGADGALVGMQKCSLNDPWIDGPGATVTQDFSCIANVGTAGPGTEMPFAAFEQALGEKSESGGPNEGFYRKGGGSLLVIVIITDEDDCSIENGGLMKLSGSDGADCSEKTSTGLYTVAGANDFLSSVSGGPARYVVVGIAGPSACSSEFGDAINAKRVQALVDMAGTNGVFGDICSGDLWISLQTALETMKLSCDDMPPPV
jgi:hypothetical protein